MQSSANTFDLEPFFKELGFQLVPSDDEEDESLSYMFEGNPFDVHADLEWTLIAVIDTLPSGAGGGHLFTVDFLASSDEGLGEKKGIFLDNIVFDYNLDSAITLVKIKRILQYLVKCLEMPYT
jgi:hypothetical protein